MMLRKRELHHTVPTAIRRKLKLRGNYWKGAWDQKINLLPKYHGPHTRHHDLFGIAPPWEIAWRLQNFANSNLRLNGHGSLPISQLSQSLIHESNLIREQVGIVKFSQIPIFQYCRWMPRHQETQIVSFNLFFRLLSEQFGDATIAEIVDEVNNSWTGKDFFSNPTDFQRVLKLDPSKHDRKFMRLLMHLIMMRRNERP